MKRKNSGITLIALIITIIIMLILAGVTISIVGGSDGLIAKAEKAVSETEKAAMQEDAELAIAAIKMDYYENYAANRAKYANAKAFIVEKLQDGYETSRGAIMEADEDGNITYTFDGIATAVTIDDNGKVTLGASSGSGDDSSGGTTTPAVQYTVTYNANGGIGAPTDSNEYAEGATVTVNFATIPTKSGNTFLGWSTNASATAANYTSTGTTSFIMGTANVTLYAVWEDVLVSLQIGDTVSYSPSGTYTWAAEYASSDLADDGSADVALSSASGEDYNITSWKVFSIDESTGKVELVPSAPTTGNVTLKGAQGYNNGVKLLNDACSSLYGDSSKGITARSINMDDLENVMYYENGEKINYVEYYKLYFSPDNYRLGENYQPANAFTTDISYPTIYEQEDLSVITYNEGEEETKVATGTGLGRSEQTSFIGRTAAGLVSGDTSSEGFITTAAAIRPYGTFRGVYNYYYYNYIGVLFGKYQDIVLPSGNKTKYWVASRSISVFDAEYDGVTHCNFHIYNINSGEIYATRGLFDLPKSHNSKSSGLFPVVSLDINLLTGNSADGWEVK